MSYLQGFPKRSALVIVAVCAAFIYTGPVQAQDECLEYGGYRTCSEPRFTEWKHNNCNAYDNTRRESYDYCVGFRLGTWVTGTGGVCTDFLGLPESDGVMQSRLETWGDEVMPESCGEWDTDMQYATGFGGPAPNIGFCDLDNIPEDYVLVNGEQIANYGIVTFSGERRESDDSCTDFSRDYPIYKTRRAICPDGSDAKRLKLGDGDYLGYCVENDFEKVNQCTESGRTPNPLTAFTPHKEKAETDYVGFGISYTRHYNSVTHDLKGLATESSSAGRAAMGSYWRHGYDQRLQLPISGRGAMVSAQIRSPSGGIRAFDLAGDEIRRSGGVGARLLRTSSGGYRITEGNGSSRVFNAAGLMIKSVDALGRTTRVRRSAGLITSITGPFGHQLKFTYNSRGLLKTMTDPGGGVYLYKYNADNNLAALVRPDGTTRTYLYENTDTELGRGQLTGIVDGEGRRIGTFEYNTKGVPYKSYGATLPGNAEPQRAWTRVGQAGGSNTSNVDLVGSEGEIRRIAIARDASKGARLITRIGYRDLSARSQSYDADNNLTESIAPGGLKHRYVYNELGQRTAVTVGDGVDARTVETEHRDALSRFPKTVSRPSVVDGELAKVVYEYADSANPNQPTKITETGFTDDGSPIKRVTKVGYGAHGFPVKVDGPRVDVKDITKILWNDCKTGGACGRLRSATNALGHVTTFDAYDAHGRLLQSTLPSGLVSSYRYDAMGRLSRMTHTPRGGKARVTTFKYNAAGQLRTSIAPSGAKQKYTYDADGNLSTVTDSLGNRIDYRYNLRSMRTGMTVMDPDGQIVREVDQVIDAVGAVESINDAGATSQFESDGAGRLTSFVDPNGNAPETLSYDRLGRLTRMLDSLGGETRMAYDRQDNTTSVQAPNGAVTEYRYDDFGNLTREISRDRGLTTYTYDRAGNMLTRTDARGVIASYTYDALNRTTRVDYPGGREDVTFSYDSCIGGVGRVCAVKDESGRTFYSYDGFGNVASEVRQLVRGGITESFKTQYRYDVDGRLSAMGYPNGRWVYYDRDVLGRVIAVRTLFNGVQSSVLKKRSFHADGRVYEQKLGNGVVESRGYDLRGRLLDQTLRKSGVPIWARSYTHDANGNVTAYGEGAATRDYGYDALDRLVSESTGGVLPGNALPSINYEYDANANRLSTTVDGVVTINQIAAGSNRIEQIGDDVVEYDAAGNTLSDRAGARGFEYNKRGRIKRVSVQGEVVGSYRYNHLGIRTEKRLPRTNGSERVIQYFHDPLGNIIAVRKDGKWVSDSIWLGWQPLRQAKLRRGSDAYSEKDVRYFTGDNLASARVMTDANGAIEDVWRATAFGAGDNQDSVTDYRFPGQVYDAESGLFYNQQRYYDPNTGRYVTSDPIGLGGGLNTYGYAYGNPAAFYDPTGELVPLAYAGALAAAWLITEITLTFVDFVHFVQVVLDECATTGDRVLAGAGLVAGVALPGGGYGIALNQIAKRAGGVAKRSDHSANAANNANGPRLRDQLRLESAESAFKRNGELSDDAVRNATQIISKDKIKNPAVPSGFGKYRTETYDSPAGPFNAHFYRNAKTGESYYGKDYKIYFRGK